MSSQWEVVGKSNKKVNIPSKKLSKTEKKKFVENAPKIEDILPLDQIRTLYNAFESKKENTKAHETVVKETQKKPKQKQKPAALDKEKQVKLTLPKTLDAAAKLIEVKELKHVVELNQARFPDVPVLWLKGLAEYLNVRLKHSGAVPLARPKDIFLASLPADARGVLQKALQQPPPAALQQFFDPCLAAMVSEMSKGNMSVVGYKILIQLVAQHSASTVLANPAKVQALWKTYQNQQPIGLVILWAIGQLGMKDVAIGLRVWQDFMLPLLDIKNYSNFAVSYLIDMSSTARGKSPVPVDHLMTVIDFVHSGRLPVPANQNKDLDNITSSLLKKTFEYKPESRLRLYFLPILERLSSGAFKSLESELLADLLLCLKLDIESFSTWQQIYRKHASASASLLQHIRNGQWKDLHSQKLQETLISFQSSNKKLLQDKRQRESAISCQASCEALLLKSKKMAVKRKAKSFPWRLGSFLLLLTITGLLAFDVRRHGSFESSSTGLLLKNVGALKYLQQAWTHTKYYSTMVGSWTAENLPVYYRIVSEKSGPYLQQSKEMLLVACSYLNQAYWNIVAYAQERAPIVEAWCDQYAPGLVNQVQTQLLRAWVLSKDCVLWLGDASIQQSHLIFNWTKANVFVGSLSPEKLQLLSQGAINTTQEYAVRTYQWVLEQYNTMSSVQ